MDWISQNWLWIVVLVGGYVLMTRMGMGGCGMGMGHSHGRNHAGEHDHGPDDAHGNVVDLFDPVSRHMMSAATGFASVHEGHVYHFEERANRDAFEADPEKYLGGNQTAGQPARATSDTSHQTHRGHGCC